MDSDLLIDVEGVSKKFCRSLKRTMFYAVTDLARQTVGLSRHTDQLRQNEFWALKDVSFQLRRGECLGVLGPNGAGKSTLLKLLSGIIRPDEGRIQIRGRLGALIEVGAGFHPMLTGRENIYTNGQIHGMSRVEIDRKLPDIIAFAGIDDFLDTPVKFYSSGMFVRLGFAVAAHLQPDILLIDEVLAVGDVGFRAKCLNHCRELLPDTAVVFISHNMNDISRVSSRAALLEAGRLTPHDDVPSAITTHLGHMLTPATQDAQGSGSIEFVAATVNGHDEATTGKALTLDFEMEAKQELPEVWFGVAISLDDGRRLFADTHVIEKVGVGKFRVRLECDACPIGQGAYWLGLFIWGEGRRELLYQNFYLQPLRVVDPTLDTTKRDGPLRLPAQWSVSPQ